MWKIFIPFLSDGQLYVYMAEFQKKLPISLSREFPAAREREPPGWLDYEGYPDLLGPFSSQRGLLEARAWVHSKGPPRDLTLT